MYAQHHRFQIWNNSQHPYSHPAEEIAYANDGLPGVINLGAALDWILAVLYPNQKEAVATVGDLPAAGNTINDYRVVNDDGDGKAASYRWEQREGDVAPKWYKIYDMDWGEQSILSNFLNQTQDVYAYKPGMDDLDDTGTPYAGDLGGQRIYGGASAGTNLILYANSGDGTGLPTGSIFAGDKLEPLTDSTFTLGSASKKWSDFHAVQSTIGDISVSGASILSSTGAISFGDENLSTTGTYTAGSLLLGSGSITDSSGAIDFGDEDLSTTGDIAANTADLVQLNTQNIFHGGGGGEVAEASSLVGANAQALKFNFSAAQTFTAASSNELLNAKFTLRRTTATTGNIYARLRSTTGGVPDGGAGGVLISSNPVAVTSVPTSDTVVTFTFPAGFNLVSGTVYAIEIDGSEIGVAPQAVNSFFGIGTFAGGEMYSSADDGASWVAFGADMNFEVNSSGAVGIDGVIKAVSGVYGASSIVNADVDAAAAIEFSKMEALTGDRAVLTDGSGVISVSPVTATELSYVGGVTSSIQTQINGKANLTLSNLSSPTAINQDLVPVTNGSRDLGTSVRRWQEAWINILGDGANVVNTSVLTSFRNATGTVDGQTLFWNDTTNTWEVSTPDAEIDHNTISNLTVGDPHLQYAYLNGRATGQTLIGSYTSNEYLTLIGAANAGGGTLDSSYAASTDTAIPGGLMYAQSFTATTALNISSAVFRLYNNVGATGNVVVNLRSVTGSTPDGGPGGILATSSPIDAATIPATSTEITFPFVAGPALVIGTKYALEVDIGGLTTEIGHRIDNSGATYPGGSMHFTVDDGATFNSGYADRDLWFQVYTQAGAVTSGGVRIADQLLPDTDDTRDIGSGGLRWNDLLMSGQFKGGRIENITQAAIGVTVNPSALSIGRMYWVTDSKDLLIDTGVSLQRLSQENIVVDMDNTIWDGATSSYAVNVSADIEDATKAIWAFYDADDGYKEVYIDLLKTATQVTMQSDVPLPAGNYRLVGIR